MFLNKDYQKINAYASILKRQRKAFIIVATIIIFLLVSVLIYREVVETIVFPILSFSFPATTKTQIGFKGDPIDVLLVGDENTIKKAFIAAHWVVPDPTNRNTTKRIIAASLHNSSYPTAPVSNLYLYKRKEDLAFELPTNTVRMRHHIRLWRTPYILSGKSIWAGADTYDSRIELSPRGLFPTHHVDSNIDKERDFLLSTLLNARVVKEVNQYRLTSPILLGFNGNGDWYRDDGRVNVIQLK